MCICHLSIQTIELSLLHAHSRKLNFSQTLQDNDLELECTNLVEKFMKHFHNSDRHAKIEMYTTLSILVDRSTNYLYKPLVKQRNYGGPSKVESSTRRDPSSFEYVLADGVPYTSMPNSKLITSSIRE